MNPTQTKTDFHRLRKAWESYLLGSGMDLGDPDAQTIIASLDRIAGQNIGYRPETAFASEFTAIPQFTLRALAMAYRTPGTKYYGQEETARYILSELERIYETEYNFETSPDNWWVVEVGIPLRTLDILVLMYDQLPDREGLIRKYTDVILHFKDAYLLSSRGMPEGGANLIWKCSILMLTGILRREQEWIDFANREIPGVLSYVTARKIPGAGEILDDGFYRDGSFVQHFCFAYTGGYGKHLISILSGMLYAYRGTGALALPQASLDLLYRMVFEAYAPLIQGGRFMDLARGRESSRYFYEDKIAGRHVLRALCYLSETMPPAEKARTRGMIRGWLTDDQTAREFLVDTDGHAEYFVHPSILPLYHEILKAEPLPPLVQNRTYGAMAKTVHHAPKFTMAVSMYSDKIAMYERLNNESLKFWHVSDGMTYLYTADADRYNGDFYATVDMQRLPGTTVDRSPGRAQDEYFSWYEMDSRNVYAFAGGVTVDGKNGMAGMRYRGQGIGKTRDLEVKKSWFFFEREVLCMGSGIRSGTGNPIETIVENRRLHKGETGEITVNQKRMSRAQTGRMYEETPYPAVRTLHLAGHKGIGSHVGYFFPKPTPLNLLWAHREGTWNALKPNPAHVKCNDFVTAWIPHGRRPGDGDYAYAVVPGVSAAELADYGADAPVEILENTVHAHAVRQKSLGIWGVNFWDQSPYCCRGIRSDGQAAVMVREIPQVPAEEAPAGECPREWRIALSDPTNGGREICLDFEVSASEILDCDPRIRVAAKSPLRIRADTAGLLGETLKLRVLL